MGNERGWCLMYKIVRKTEVAPEIYRIEIADPYIPGKARAGQFVIIIPDEDGERVPFTISDWDPGRGTFVIYTMAVGVSTQKMAAMSEGDEFFAVVGPLGKPATIEKEGSVLVGGGCYGLGAIYPIARAYREAGNHVTCIAEGRTEEVLFNIENLKEVSDDLIVCTTRHEDGRSKSGKAQDMVAELIANGRKFDRAYFIGCSYMMMICSVETKKHGIPTYVALNSLMVDGTGMCGCCRVSVGGKTRFACVHGPEFDGHQVDWEELFNRNAVYYREEIAAAQHHACRALQGVGL